MPTSASSSELKSIAPLVVARSNGQLGFTIGFWSARLIFALPDPTLVFGKDVRTADLVAKDAPFKTRGTTDKLMEWRSESRVAARKPVVREASLISSSNVEKSRWITSGGTRPNSFCSMPSMMNKADQ